MPNNTSLKPFRYRALAPKLNLIIHLTKSPKCEHIYKMCLYMLKNKTA